ncbi:MAG: DUF4382 domain-containing protein [Bacteroidales bacterium]|nr:MAG: DUF4382 domain-containing protein [Bacteroidales bacterium]
MPNYRLILPCIVGIIIILVSCEELQDPPPDYSHTALYVKLKDKSSEYEEVNIDILIVSATINDTVHALFTNAGIYNLLDYIGLKDTVLASKEVPIGHLSQIRLILGKNNSIKVKGEYHELKAPSAGESGLKLNIHEELWYGVEYTYLLDFDVEKSIVVEGKKYLLKPVIRVISENLSGTIRGVVHPPYAKPKVTAYNDRDTLNVYSDENTGEYVFRGVPPDTYDLLFKPEDPYNDTILYGIEVEASKTVKLDTLFLN